MQAKDPEALPHAGEEEIKEGDGRGHVVHVQPLPVAPTRRRRARRQP